MHSIAYCLYLSKKKKFPNEHLAWYSLLFVFSAENRIQNIDSLFYFFGHN